MAWKNFREMLRRNAEAESIRRAEETAHMDFMDIVVEITEKGRTTRHGPMSRADALRMVQFYRTQPGSRRINITQVAKAA
jgi:hypothetical protein